jgi:hypothetical protein
MKYSLVFIMDMQAADLGAGRGLSGHQARQANAEHADIRATRQSAMKKATRRPVKPRWF